MYTLNGFFSIPALSNNTPNAVAPFGELSVLAQTYTQSQSQWSNTASDADVELTTFTLTDSFNNPVVPSNTFMNTVLALGEYVFQQQQANAIPLNVNVSAFVASIQAQFPSFSNIFINQILQVGSILMPDYVRFIYSDGANQYQCYCWFADSAFRTQFSPYKIYVIPPVTDLTQLSGGSTASVLTSIQAVSIDSVLETADGIVGNSPPTKLKPFQVTWHDPANASSTVVTTWTLVIYGAAGINNDAIKAAISAYIAANSTATNWNVTYPALYAENEFILVPLWSNIAAPADSVDAGIYSPIALAGSLTALMASKLPSSYAAATNITTFMGLYLTVAATTYQSALMLALGNPNNTGAKYNILQMFPDYIAIDSTSPDFPRMSLLTQNFVLALIHALEVAATLQPTDTTPAGYTLVVYNGRTFLSFPYNGYNWLVLAKFSNSI
jgi:hypothetical protein